MSRSSNLIRSGRRVCLLLSLMMSFSFVDAFAATAPASPLPPSSPFETDLKFLFKELAENYAYTEPKGIQWRDLQTTYVDKVKEVRTRDQFVALLEKVVDELRDAHAGLGTNLPNSFRLVPTGADLWATWKDGHATVNQVRMNSAAAKAGMTPGIEILSINGISILGAVEARLGKKIRDNDVEATNWALRSVLAGRHNQERKIEVRLAGATKTFTLPAADPPHDANEHELLTTRRIDRFGLIRIRNSLGDNNLIGAFDSALNTLRDTSGLIVDLRDTPSGGNTTVARAIMSRFIASELPYQKHVDMSDEREFGVRRSWLELVSPRGPFTYTGPVVVLVDHWTGSVSEAITIGFDALKRGTIVGTEMAGLAGAVSTTVLPKTKIKVNFPTERLYHVNGTPREKFVPGVYVDVLANPEWDGADPILEAGLSTLKAMAR
jgi:C-terminal processing protease CtpA/Prc